MSKEQILWDELKSKNLFSSVEVVRIGMSMYYKRADRTVRQWVRDGRLRALDTSEKILRGLVKKGNRNIAWYELVNNG